MFGRIGLFLAVFILAFPVGRAAFSADLSPILQQAARGDAGAQYNLGIIYQTGQGVAQDYVQAATWYQKAADQEYAGAEFNLALMYEDGQGVPQDYTQAAAWYRKAADQGDGRA